MKIADTVEKFSKGRTQSSLTLFLVVGVYLLYLAYKIITGILSGDDGNLIVLLFALIFILVGAALVGGGLYALYMGWNKEQLKTEDGQELPEISEEEE